MMIRPLNLDDIQGNVTRAYGRYSYPCARYFFLHIGDTATGRAFVGELRGKVTTAARWTPETKPQVTLNVAFTFAGLKQLGLPTRTLQSMPDEYIDGMKARAFILGDKDNSKISVDDNSWCQHWDSIWQNNRAGKGEDVHMWISMNAQVQAGTDKPVSELEEQTQWLRNLCSQYRQNVRILTTNGQNGDEEYQSANAIFQTLPNGTKIPTAKEHFGLTDGIGDPVFAGQYAHTDMVKSVAGRGKWVNAKNGWQPLATGEFILGHVDESQELPPTAVPPEYTNNGTYMVYRKLHENVATFQQVLDQETHSYARAMDVPQDQARETLMAKMVGRWSDGVPLSKVPTYQAWRDFQQAQGFNNPDPGKAAAAYYRYLKSDDAVNFRYGDDMQGYKCPVTSHLRRSNTRDYLDPHNNPNGDNPDATSQLNKRRRILRRGLPYGPTALGVGDDSSEQGVVFMVICANISRQYEFVQQQWIQYGLDFNSGNNTCPLLGNHAHHKRHVIPSDPQTGKPPYVMSKLKTFVETRGGDYFFIPSMTALRMMAMGIVDPT